MDELLTDFLTETAENLTALDEAVLTLERVPDDPATIALVFRLVHTVKGTCGFLALPRLERVAHAAEGVLCALRDGERQATAEIITVVLQALDRIRMIVDALVASGAEPVGDDAALLLQLAAIEAARPTQSALAFAAPSKALPDAPVAIGPAAVAAPEPAHEPAGRATHPAAPLAANEDGHAAASRETTRDASSGVQTIRLGVDVLENLMRLVSELVLTRNQLTQLARSQSDSRFAAPLQRLSHLTSDLQEGVVKTRMQPIMHAWRKLPRLVRDLGGELGKQVKLSMTGGETELDRQVLELIQDPLTHMVRNSLDHGLESPERRLAAGKPAIGRITLSSRHEGGHVVIEVGDDGAGLASDAIRERLLSRGLATAAELAAMSEHQLHQHIFHAGFSTAAAVTAVSGRGVGMDVVKANVERLGGTVDVSSVAGAGANFTVKIPLTLAIISALIVESAGLRFALPEVCVSELVRANTGGTPSDDNLVVERLDATPVLRLRKRLLPLVTLGSLLGRPAGGSAAAAGSAQGSAPGSASGRALTVIVAKLGGVTVGLVVDQVFDTEEIVVKPVSPVLRHITMYGGATILGDGSVIMILDPSGMARAIGPIDLADCTPARTEQAAPAVSGERAPMLLVRLSPGATPVAIPLGLVARIESVPRAEIEVGADRAVMQYRGRLMPLLRMDDQSPLAETVPVLVFSDRGRRVGLMTSDIVDVVEDHLKIELSSTRPGLLGTAIIAGRVTDVVDTAQLLERGLSDWFQDDPARNGARRPRLLVVEDSAFFRQLLVPILSAAGFHVTAVDAPPRALAMRDSASFDAIVSDVEMPEMDGLHFARVVRSGGGPWEATPMIALSNRCKPVDVRHGLDAGFNEYVGKFDRDGLLAALRRQLDAPERRAA